MTNNEIIKALECCIHDDEGTKERPCQDCPLLRDDSCSNSLRKLSLDLIKRRQAEIEKKDIEIDILIRKKEALMDEVERLKARNDELNALNKSASIEAVKATIVEIGNRLCHYGKCDEVYMYEVLDVMVEVEEELTNTKSKEADENKRAKIAMQCIHHSLQSL